AKWFFRYDPGASSDFSRAQEIQEAAHAFDALKTGPSSPMTAGDVAQRVAHPFAEASPNGKSGGVEGGMCPSCKGSEAVQLAEAALQAYAVVNGVRGVAMAVGRAI